MSNRIHHADDAYLLETIELFVKGFQRKSICVDVKRIVVKEYEKDYSDVLEKAGFRREMMDYVLYR